MIYNDGMKIMILNYDGNDSVKAAVKPEYQRNHLNHSKRQFCLCRNFSVLAAPKF